jgi:hypothetical protein
MCPFFFTCLSTRRSVRLARPPLDVRLHPHHVRGDAHLRPAKPPAGARADDVVADPGAEPSSTMLEFAEAGFPSDAGEGDEDDGDVLDPRARDRQMNRVVEEIHELVDAELDVLGRAFALVDKLGFDVKVPKPEAGKTEVN